MGHPDTKTIFNIENEEDKKDIRFKSLTTIAGRKLSVFFDYEEDGVKKHGRTQLTIPKTDSEEEIKQFILEKINLSI